MPLFRHPILLAPPETSASTAGVTVSWSTPGLSRASPPRWSTTTMAESSDDRDSPIYATRGYYALGSFRVYPTWLGSDSEWQSFQTDFRTYAPTQLPGRGVFAMWATTWFTFGSPPYLELPAIGWDTYQRSGRGYPQGRVRGENQGAAAFVNLLATSDPITRGFEKVYAVGVEGAKRLFLGTGEAF